MRCGDPASGGCIGSSEQRLKLVEVTAENNIPYFQENGCQTAPQTLDSTFAYGAENCLSATECLLEPEVPSNIVPQWGGLKVVETIDNFAVIPKTYDVCYCDSQCTTAANWFKVKNAINQKKPSRSGRMPQ